MGQYSTINSQRYFFLECVFWFCIFTSVLAADKIWIPNTNFNNAKNWENERVPCYADRVSFPRDTDIAVFIQDNVTIRDMLLPQSGELILASQSQISFWVDGVGSSYPCEGKGAHFTGSDVQHWYDPYNWEVGDDWGNLKMGAAAMLDPVPHAEKIPCSYDDVIFPPNSTFKVRVEGMRPIIKKLTVNGKALNSNKLKSFLESQSGHKQFQIDTSLSLLGQSCSDSTGCICGNDDPSKLRHVCNHVLGKCPMLHCTDPVQPTGSCCSLCGAVMTFTLNAGFELQKMKRYIGSYLQKSFYSGISAYVFKTYLGKIQVVFVDNEPHHSTDLLKTLQEQFDKDNEKSWLGIRSYEAHLSTKWFYGPYPLNEMSNGMSPGGIAALLIGLLAVIVIGVLFYFQRHKLIPLAFSFGRLENEDDDYRSRGSLDLAVEMTQSVDPLTGKQMATATIHLPEAVSGSAKGFDNPFYDPSCTDPIGFKDASLSKKGYKSVDTRENPCYMAFESVEDLPSTPAEVGAVAQIGDRDSVK